MGWCFTFVSSSFLDCEVLWTSGESFVIIFLSFLFMVFWSLKVFSFHYFLCEYVHLCEYVQVRLRFSWFSFFLPILFFLLGNISIVLSVFKSAPRISGLSDRCRGFCFVSVCPRPCLSYRFTPRVFHKVVLTAESAEFPSHNSNRTASDVCVKSLRFEIAKWIAKVFVKYRHYWLE